MRAFNVLTISLVSPVVTFGFDQDENQDRPNVCVATATRTVVAFSLCLMRETITRASLTLAALFRDGGNQACVLVYGHCITVSISQTFHHGIEGVSIGKRSIKAHAVTKEAEFFSLGQICGFASSTTGTNQSGEGRRQDDKNPILVMCMMLFPTDKFNYDEGSQRTR
ncbi:hypothetical protein OH491_27720 (plasmid) [Termitidicoccus mucosus]|uniref:hypothetical protein n=1 Tax=Termitidicoccus mucosus TaxID=1184151 RepID=UPI003183A13B